MALRDEMIDLEGAGIGIIQVDEAAYREGLPLRNSNWEAYLKWAADAFLPGKISESNFGGFLNILLLRSLRNATLYNRGQYQSFFVVCL